MSYLQIALAFQHWADVTPLTFTDVTGSGIVPDITISFVEGAHGDAAPFDGLGGDLAHALVPVLPAAWADIKVHYDGQDFWTLHDGRFEGTSMTLLMDCALIY